MYALVIPRVGALPSTAIVSISVDHCNLDPFIQRVLEVFNTCTEAITSPLCQRIEIQSEVGGYNVAVIREVQRRAKRFLHGLLVEK